MAGPDKPSRVDTTETGFRSAAQGTGVDLRARVQEVRGLLGRAPDIRSMWLSVPGPPRTRAALIYVRGLTDLTALRRHVLAHFEPAPPPGDSPDGHAPGAGSRHLGAPPKPAQDIVNKLAPVEPRRPKDRQDLVDRVLSGEALLLLAADPQPWLLRTSGGKERPVSRPSTESSLRGAGEAFMENLEVNVALVRRRIRDPRLVVEETRLGPSSRVLAALMYVEGLARPELVQEVQKRLRRVTVDAVIDASQLAEVLVGRYRTPFPLHMSTERPDRTAAWLMAGRVVLLLDGSPWAILLPVRLLDFFFSVDDYYLRPAVIAVLRLARIAAWMGIVLFPALYVALEAHNVDVLRLELMLAIDAARAGVPLNVVLESLFLIIMVELNQETAIRLPEKVGASTTIIGALIIGEAVARARLVSDIIIVIIAMAAIGSLTFPDREIGAAWRTSSGLLLLGGGVMGLFGVFLGLMLLLFHLCSLESVGMPYLHPLAPLNLQDLWQDGLTRRHWWEMPDRGPRPFVPPRRRPS